MKASPKDRLYTRLLPRRGLSREEAASYLGISPSKFDELRKDGRVGAARLIDGRKVWDIRALDQAFDALPHEGDDTDDWKVGV
jgi:excisionase family DNA binding protein